MRAKSLIGRNFIFGAEDGFVSTVGFLSGIAAASVSRQTIFLTGVILILVEAFSMAVGSFLSEYETQEYLQRHEIGPQKPLVGAVTMFFSYAGSGLIPLLPYVFLPIGSALYLSISLTLVSLFILGMVSAKLYQLKVLKHALQMLVLGSIAIAIGIASGRLLNAF